jgi:hypothetical protein
LFDPAAFHGAVEADPFQDLVEDAGDDLGEQVADQDDEQGAASLGTNVITLDQALETPPWKSTASGMNEILWLRGTPPVQAGTSGTERALGMVLVDE